MEELEKEWFEEKFDDIYFESVRAKVFRIEMWPWIKQKLKQEYRKGQNKIMKELGNKIIETEKKHQLELKQEIDNWEVHGSNSGCAGIVYNHPKKGDESVCLKNKITNKIVYKVLGK